jgi:hypothetical protein
VSFGRSENAALAHLLQFSSLKKFSGGHAMKPTTQELVIADRISTRRELNEVIGLLIIQHLLPFEATLESLESSGKRSEAEGLDLWTQADGDRRPGAEIEPLTNIILGRKNKVNWGQNSA